MCFLKHRWWNKLIRQLQSGTVSYEEKQQLVESITAQLSELSDAERDDAYEQLLGALETLSHRLFIDYSWEQGPDETCEWKNPIAHKLSNACIAVKNQMKRDWDAIRVADLQD